MKAPGPVAAGQAQGGSSRATIVTACCPDSKSLAHATAQAALAGFTLHELASGGFLLGRGTVRELATLQDVHAALAQMGVPL